MKIHLAISRARLGLTARPSPHTATHGFEPSRARAVAHEITIGVIVVHASDPTSWTRADDDGVAVFNGCGKFHQSLARHRSRPRRVVRVGFDVVVHAHRV